jgi:hypothetical protein
MSTIAGLDSFSLDIPVETAVPAPASMVQLDMHVEHQAQDEWCWAAVTSAVSKFSDSNSAWSQCAVASRAFPDGKCCEDGSSDACDRTWDLDKALEITGNLKRYAKDEQAAVATLVEQMKLGAPVGIRIQWTSGKGHFVIIRGATEEGPGLGTVAISDPVYEDSVHVVEDLNGNYLNGDGVWTDTYYTKA